ncbi:hypothetical protein [Agrobacterium sp. NCPPB 925]|uniref:hypothetical protein n=1 Tax=Agrobacterium sp. NCPPB 925 TaxID=1631629 RepID=UPI0009CC8AA1|nr:hypothetical protein [Agrobacterium sp. NCPPB 925]CUX69998.1 hypothetical protein AGR6A_pAt20003 [Agrobacterium sp. NCPPB 925]
MTQKADNVEISDLLTETSWSELREMPEASGKGAQFALAKLIAIDRDREVGIGNQTFCDLHSHQVARHANSPCRSLPQRAEGGSSS